MNKKFQWFIGILLSISFFTNADTLGSVDETLLFTPGDKVLVLGASGRTGSLIVSELITRGFNVSASVRNLDRGRNVLGENVSLIKADLTDVESLRVATKGVKGVINAASGTPVNYEQVDFGGMKNLITVAKENKVEKLVLLSSIGVTDENHYLNKVANNVLIWKFKAEEALRNSALPYVVVRPGGLTDKAGGEKSIRFDQGDKITGAIPRSDVALVCVEALIQNTATNKTIDIVGGKNESNVQDFRKIFSSLVED